MLSCFADQALVLKVLKVNMASSTHTSFTSLSLVTPDGVVHLPKEVLVVLVGEVDDFLDAVNELELDTKLLVGPLEQ